MKKAKQTGTAHRGNLRLYRAAPASQEVGGRGAGTPRRATKVAPADLDARIQKAWEAYCQPHLFDNNLRRIADHAGLTTATLRGYMERDKWKHARALWLARRRLDSESAKAPWAGKQLEAVARHLLELCGKANTMDPKSFFLECHEASMAIDLCAASPVELAAARRALANVEAGSDEHWILDPIPSDGSRARPGRWLDWGDQQGRKPGESLRFGRVQDASKQVRRQRRSAVTHAS